MMQTSTTPTIFDVRGLAALKSQAKSQDPAALKATAQQFEALFLQMVLKSMRDATPHEGLMESDQTRLYESLLDQQLSQVMAAKGGTGLAAMIEKQLTRNTVAPPAGETDLPLRPLAQPYPLEQKSQAMPLATPVQQPVLRPLSDTPVRPAREPEAAASSTQRQFVDQILPHAVEASRASGVPAAFMVAQAALETGWGRSEPRRADGRPSYNIFGIKAGRGWSGATVAAATTEYVDGVAQQRTERFRAYGSYAEAFADYTRLLSSNPRYAGVVASMDGQSFARQLQQAGYASDPAYAEKLTRIIGGPTLRLALAD